ncbi:uncharacterized protein [Aegilops tauschii subsp. strangulata]|uniref:uncharacterized protein n=1 Tax=Aegilops tauschii subsp. strangulata TaxID=200361 RepID=UPI003CC86E2D
MPPKKLPKSKTGFFGMRAKPSSNFNVEFFDADRRFWLIRYTTADKGARAYDVAVWCAGRPKTNLYFPEIETRANAKFLVLEGIQIEEITKTTKKRPTIAEQEYFWKREAEHKKKELKKEDEASPWTVIPVESSKADDEEF